MCWVPAGHLDSPKMGATKFLFKAERELFMDEFGIYGFYMLRLLDFYGFLIWICLC